MNSESLGPRRGGVDAALKPLDAAGNTEYVSKLEAKVRKQAAELLQLSLKLESATTYANICQKRCQQLVPGHPIPILAEHLGGFPESSAEGGGVVLNPRDHRAVPAYAVAKNAETRRLERECAEQIFSLKRRVVSLEEERSGLVGKLKVERHDRVAREREAAFFSKTASDLTAKLEDSRLQLTQLRVVHRDVVEGGQLGSPAAAAVSAELSNDADLERRLSVAQKRCTVLEAALEIKAEELGLVETSTSDRSSAASSSSSSADGSSRDANTTVTARSDSTASTRKSGDKSLTGDADITRAPFQAPPLPQRQPLHPNRQPRQSQQQQQQQQRQRTAKPPHSTPPTDGPLPPRARTTTSAAEATNRKVEEASSAPPPPSPAGFFPLRALGASALLFEVARLKGEAAALTSSLRSQESANSSKATEARELTLRNEALSQQLSADRQALATLQRTVEQTKGAAECAEALGLLGKECKELVAEKQALLDYISDQVERGALLKAEAHDLKAALDTSKEEAFGLKGRVLELEGSVSALASVRAQVGRAQEASAQLKQAVEGLEEKVREKSASLEEAQALQRELLNQLREASDGEASAVSTAREAQATASESVERAKTLGRRLVEREASLVEAAASRVDLEAQQRKAVATVKSLTASASDVGAVRELLAASAEAQAELKKEVQRLRPAWDALQEVEKGLLALSLSAAAMEEGEKNKGAPAFSSSSSSSSLSSTATTPLLFYQQHAAWVRSPSLRHLSPALQATAQLLLDAVALSEQSCGDGAAALECEVNARSSERRALEAQLLSCERKLQQAAALAEESKTKLAVLQAAAAKAKAPLRCLSDVRRVLSSGGEKRDGRGETKEEAEEEEGEEAEEAQEEQGALELVVSKVADTARALSEAHRSNHSLRDRLAGTFRDLEEAVKSGSAAAAAAQAVAMERERLKLALGESSLARVTSESECEKLSEAAEALKSELLSLQCALEQSQAEKTLASSRLARVEASMSGAAGLLARALQRFADPALLKHAQERRRGGRRGGGRRRVGGVAEECSPEVAASSRQQQHYHSHRHRPALPQDATSSPQHSFFPPRLPPGPPCSASPSSPFDTAAAVANTTPTPAQGLDDVASSCCSALCDLSELASALAPAEREARESEGLADRLHAAVGRLEAALGREQAATQQQQQQQQQPLQLKQQEQNRPDHPHTAEQGFVSISSFAAPTETTLRVPSFSKGLQHAPGHFASATSKEVAVGVEPHLTLNEGAQRQRHEMMEIQRRLATLRRDESLT